MEDNVMRRRIVIELDAVGHGQDRSIMDKIAFLAIKAIAKPEYWPATGLCA